MLAIVKEEIKRVYLAEHASAVKPHLTKTTLLNNSVYVLLATNGNKSDFYIGSRIAGSNRNRAPRHTTLHHTTLHYTKCIVVEKLQNISKVNA